jgi:hypothetical protein
MFSVLAGLAHSGAMNAGGFQGATMLPAPMSALLDFRFIISMNGMNQTAQLQHPFSD